MPSRFYRVPLSEITYLRAILEGYDGIALVRARDRYRGEVECDIGQGLDEEARAILVRLGREAGMVEIARPEDWDAPP